MRSIYRIKSRSLGYTFRVSVEGSECPLEKYAKLHGYDDFATMCIKMKVDPNGFSVSLESEDE